MVVLLLGMMKVWAFVAKYITLKPIVPLQYWLGITKAKNVFSMT